jgi:glycosyltransferase involved in cell wall biosynthesis
LPTLSVVVLTWNEAPNISACLTSAQPFADEVIVFDSHSKDETCEIANKMGARVVQRRFDSYPLQRNAALDAAECLWVLFLDADERVSDESGKEIRLAIGRADADPTSAVLFWVPRKNYMFGKWIRHAGWSPDYQPRLMRKGKVRFNTSRRVHELPVVNGTEAFLKEPLVHFNYATLAQFRMKQDSYTRLEAQMLFGQGIRARRRSFVGQPLREFVRRFIALEGYKDGRYGLLLCSMMAYYSLVRQRTLARMWNERDAMET